MTPGQYKRVKELFLKAVELDPVERVSFLNDACGADDEVRREVDSLLAHDSKDTIIDRESGQQTMPDAVNVGSRRRIRRKS